MTIRSAFATAGLVVALAAVSMLSGCAKYNGNEAAFCAQLATAPSFDTVRQQVNGGTDAQAASKIDATAQQFRSLERLAPRSIRPSVGALGDSASRIAAAIRAPHGTVITWNSSPDGAGQATVQQSPNSASEGSNDWTRQSILVNEFNSHRGLSSSIFRVESFGVKTCGMDSSDTMFGLYQQFFPSNDNSFNQNFRGDGNNPGGTRTVIIPPATTMPAASSSVPERPVP